MINNMMIMLYQKHNMQKMVSTVQKFFLRNEECGPPKKFEDPELQTIGWRWHFELKANGINVKFKAMGKIQKCGKWV